MSAETFIEAYGDAHDLPDVQRRHDGYFADGVDAVVAEYDGYTLIISDAQIPSVAYVGPLADRNSVMEAVRGIQSELWGSAWA